MATSSLQLSDQIQEEFLQCKICFEVYRTPRTLSCLHSFCEPCLEQLLEKGQGSVCCPECRTVTDLQGCVRNAKASFFINSLLDLFRSKTDTQAVCSLCPSLGKTPDPASNRCLDCADFLCVPCAQGHRCSKLTLGHSVVSLQDYASGRYDKEARGKQERHCQSHQDPLRFYCRTCSTLICRDCRMLDHFSHQVLSLTQAAADRRPQLEGLIGSLDGSVRSLSQQEQEVDSALQELKEKKRSIESAIEENVSKYLSMIEEQLAALRDSTCAELSTFVDQQEQNYLSIKEDLHNHLKSAQSTVAFSRQVMQMGCDCEVLDLESSIQSHIERLQKLSIPAVKGKTPNLIINEDMEREFTVNKLFKLSYGPFNTNSKTQLKPEVKEEPTTSTQTVLSSVLPQKVPLTTEISETKTKTARKAVFVCSFVTGRQDELIPHITGLSYCNGNIILADESNSMIRCYDAEGKQMSEICTTKKIRPCSVTVCGESVYFSSRAKLYRVLPHNKFRCNELRGQNSQYPIASYKDRYIIVSEGSCCSLSLYDPKGRRLSTVQPKDYLGGTFLFVTVNSREEFIISDLVKKCVVIFKKGGEIVNVCSSTDSNSFNPFSICVDKQDNIYALEGSRVVQLSPKGEFLREFLSFTKYKTRLMLLTADDQGRLIVVTKGGMVFIYKLSY
ncbi:TRI56 ligase, partial [Amia calva]|nr:TRI56 ligase [Amia calva]